MTTWSGIFILEYYYYWESLTSFLYYSSKDTQITTVHINISAPVLWEQLIIDNDIVVTDRMCSLLCMYIRVRFVFSEIFTEPLDRLYPSFPYTIHFILPVRSCKEKGPIPYISKPYHNQNTSSFNSLLRVLVGPI